jgi:hypothetical protein
MKTPRLFAALAVLLALTAANATAQDRPAVPPPQPTTPTVVVPMYTAPPDAQATREQLHELLRQFPPNVGQVLRYDPSLLTRADYLAPYPQLVAFLQQHPEIARNASFYFGGYDYNELRRREPMPPEIEALGVLLGGMAAFLGVSAFIGVLTWLVRAVIQHRRWLRQSKVQADIHAKLMDRLTTNEELLAYIQSPAGRRFLESAPTQPESDAPRTGAPVGPIIWSMMAGIVLSTVGIGFRLAAQSVTNEAQQAFTVVGVIILALGAGFIFSSIMAYLVSSRLGLFPHTPAKDSASANA